MGAGFLVTLIEGANEMLSNELNIVVYTSFFKQKKIIFCEFSLFTFLEIDHALRGGWGLILFLSRYKRSLFGIWGLFCLLPTKNFKGYGPGLMQTAVLPHLDDKAKN